MNKSEQGITILALVITIIVLLILAGISIGAITGNNGLIGQAQSAKEETEIAQWEERIDTSIIQTEGDKRNPSMDDIIQGLIEKDIIDNASQVNKQTGVITTNEPSYDISGKLDDYIIFEPGIIAGKNQKYEDENGDIATIPKGFEILPEADTVNEGLVIQDEEENQYVWIPVDGILGENGKRIENAKNGEIILGRYVFDSNGKIDTKNAVIPETLGGELQVNRSYSNTYTETSTGNGNIPAKDIEGFIDSVRTNSGYYIGRFEASKGSNGKAENKYNKAVFDNVTQPEAFTACQDLYEEVNSDLINSYAWDTAILFIQKYGQSNYSIQNSLNSGLSTLNTGMSGDIQLNIYDMASNCFEWTTETSSDSSEVCVCRGGYCHSSGFYTSYRVSESTSYGNGFNSFRPLLYL